MLQIIRWSSCLLGGMQMLLLRRGEMIVTPNIRVGGHELYRWRTDMSSRSMNEPPDDRGA